MQERISGVKEPCSTHGYVGHISSFSRCHGYGHMRIKESFDLRGRKD